MQVHEERNAIVTKRKLQKESYSSVELCEIQFQKSALSKIFPPKRSFSNTKLTTFLVEYEETEGSFSSAFSCFLQDKTTTAVIA